MTQEEILEYNKRCAEFLSILYGLRQNGVVKEESKVRIHKILDLEETEGLHINHCKFHSDWNWIMEVVDAIEKIDRNDEHGLFRLIRYGSSCNWNDLPPSINANSSKEAVVKAINQFLIWYEQNK